MIEKLYYEVTTEDSERVGSLRHNIERDILFTYKRDLTTEAIHSYNVAWCIMDEMLSEISRQKLSSEAIDKLVEDLKAEQVYLSTLLSNMSQS